MKQISLALGFLLSIVAVLAQEEQQQDGPTTAPPAESYSDETLVDKSLVDFCLAQEYVNVVYCHPVKGRFRVYCESEYATDPKLPNIVTPFLISCPFKHVCHSHAKLKNLDFSEFGATPLTRVTYSQCVPEYKIEVDEFCEDKLVEYYSVRTESRKAASALSAAGDAAVSDPNVLDTLGHIKHCNPHSVVLGKEVLDCTIVRVTEPAVYNQTNELYKPVLQRALNAKDSYQIEIQYWSKSCARNQVCRKYDREKDAELKMANCTLFVEALCLDRFWSIYSEDFFAGIPNSLSDSMEKPRLDGFIGNRISNFMFCDPYQINIQIECNIQWALYAFPRVQHISLLSNTDNEILKGRLRAQFPDLYRDIYAERASDNEFEYQITPTSVAFVQLPCPLKTVRLLDIQENDGTFDSGLAVSGSICRQFSRKLSRCMPFPTLDLVDTAPATGPRTRKPVPVQVQNEFQGFCLSVSAPGQYCMAGSPEFGVLCPTGQLIRCTSPAPKDPNLYNDVSGNTERCVQMFGIVPPYDPHASTDPFRAMPILDIPGNGAAVSFGYWAKCVAGKVTNPYLVQQEQPVDFTVIEPAVSVEA